MTVLLSIFVVLLVGAVAALATGRLGAGMSVAMPPAAHTTGYDVLAPGEVTRSALTSVRFDRAARGYRMDQVDAVLDRLGEELAARDERLAGLMRELQGPPAWPDVDDAPAGADGDSAPSLGTSVPASPSSAPAATEPSIPAALPLADPRREARPVADGDVD